jgi:nicotinamidase-related amidase
MVLTKKVNSAFIGTNLEDILFKRNINTLVIVGMTTNHCISTTVRMSGNLGFNTYLISDSTACYNTKAMNGEVIDCNTIYNATLASLQEEFATVIDSKELFEIL